VAAKTTRTGSTKDPTRAFFESLAARGHEPLLANASGTMRFDLADGKRADHWFVKVRNGDLSVSNKEAKADAVVHVERSFFDRMVQGRENGMAAALRGVLVAQGDLGLVLLFQRLFPGPPRSRGPVIPGQGPVARSEGAR